MENMSKLAALSSKGGRLIMSSMTTSSKPYRRPSMMNTRQPASNNPMMTPSSKQVFHMLTTQQEKQEALEAVQGAMSQSSHGHGHGHSRTTKQKGMKHFSQNAIDTSWVFDQNYVINPRSYYRKAWDLLLTILVLYLIAILPWQLGVSFYHSPKELYDFDRFLEAVFWLDMIATLNTGFIHCGEVELNREAIVEHYLSTWFLIDLIGNFPFYAIIGKKEGKTFKILKWLKLNKLFRIGKLIRYLRDYVKFASVIKSTSVLVIFIHVASCLTAGELFNHHDLYHITYWDMYWHSLAEVVSLAVGGDIGENTITIHTHYTEGDDHGSGHRFLAGASPTSQPTTHGGGHDDHADSLQEIVDSRRLSNGLALPIIVIGTILIIFVSASVVVILSNHSNTTMKFKLKIENMKTELEYYDIDEALAERVMEFYDYLWFNQLNADEHSVHKDKMLSAELRRELILTIYSDMLVSTPFLTACTEDCVAAVANKLVNTIAMPTDFIIRKKDIGRELFIIKKGMVGVFNDLQYLKTLYKGQYFGEVALLGDKKQRTATVRAISVTELCVLYAEDFHSISSDYPELLVNMTQYMHATHLDADLVKNPKVQRRKTNIGEQVNAAKAGTPMPHRGSMVQSSPSGPSSTKESPPSFFSGLANMSSRAVSTVRSSLTPSHKPVPTDSHGAEMPHRKMSVGAQLTSYLMNMNGSPVFAEGHGRVQQDEHSLAFSKSPPSDQDVRGMISGLLNERLKSEPEAENEDDGSDDDDDEGETEFDGLKPSETMNNASKAHKEDDPLLIHTEAKNINKDVKPSEVAAFKKKMSATKMDDMARQGSGGETEDTPHPSDKEQVMKDKEMVEHLQAKVASLTETINSTNKHLDELSKVVFVTHAVATSDPTAAEKAKEILDDVKELSAERSSPNKSQHGGNRSADEKSTGRRKKQSKSHVHISKEGGSLYDAEREDPELYANPSSNIGSSTSFSERHTAGKIRDTPSLAKVPSVDSVDLHMSEFEAAESSKDLQSKTKDNNEVKDDKKSGSYFFTPKVGPADSSATGSNSSFGGGSGGILGIFKGKEKDSRPDSSGFDNMGSKRSSPGADAVQAFESDAT